jgi:hypothetical protein
VDEPACSSAKMARFCSCSRASNAYKEMKS